MTISPIHVDRVFMEGTDLVSGFHSTTPYIITDGVIITSITTIIAGTIHIIEITATSAITTAISIITVTTRVVRTIIMVISVIPITTAMFSDTVI